MQKMSTYKKAYEDKYNQNFGASRLENKQPKRLSLNELFKTNKITIKKG